MWNLLHPLEFSERYQIRISKMVVVADAKETLGEHKKAAKADGSQQAGNSQAYDGKNNVS